MRLAAVLLLLLPAAGAAAGEPPVPAPYQVDGVVRYKDDRHRLDDGLGLAAPLVVVDLGSAEAAHPGSEGFRRMTVIGARGVAVGTLYEIRKICNYLCGDEGEACHYQALVSLDRPLETFGTPLAAIPGDVVVSGFTPTDGEAAGAEARLPPGLIGGFATLAWPPYGEEDAELRVSGWDPDRGALALEFRWSPERQFTAEGRACRVRPAGPLTQVGCDGLAMIAAGAAPLLLSWPDYNMPAADAVARLEAGGQTLHLVRLGLKAQTVFGFLYRGAEGWHGLFRPRDYALLC